MRHKIIRLLGLALAGMFLAGCASAHKMTLDANKKSLDKVTNPIGVFTLRTKNAVKPSYQPQVAQIQIVAGGTREANYFVVKEPWSRDNEYLEYLVSFDLPPGNYSVGNIFGLGEGFLIQGNFNYPVNAQFTLTNGVSYLGQVTMVNRKRVGDEKRSGSIFPLVDQAVTGFGDGTFDITVTDRSESDIPAFVRAYPLLKDVRLTKAIMQK